MREAFRRSVRVVWPHFWIVFLMITSRWPSSTSWSSSSRTWCPTSAVFLVFLTNFALGFAFGVALGFVEVSLAERLVTGAHGPGQDVRSEDVELPGGAATA